MSTTLNAYDEYLAAIDRGKRLCKDLQSFAREPRTYPTMQSLYNVETNPLRINVVEKIKTALAGCGLSTSNMIYIDVRNIGKGTSDDATYTNHIDGRSGVIVCSENYKGRDENSPSQRLWPSEILWQSWLMAVKEQGKKTIRSPRRCPICCRERHDKQADLGVGKTVDLYEKGREWRTGMHRLGPGLLRHSGKPQWGQYDEDVNRPSTRIKAPNGGASSSVEEGQVGPRRTRVSFVFNSFITTSNTSNKNP